MQRRHWIGVQALCLLVSAGWFGLPGTMAWGQDPLLRFGTAHLQYKSVHAVAFEAGYSDTTWNFVDDQRYCAGYLNLSPESRELRSPIEGT